MCSSDLENRIDAFLLKVKNDLATMSADDFEKNKNSLITKRLEKLKNLESETNRLWAYINNEYFNFYQVDQDVAAIRRLTKEDVKDFFDKYIDPESESRAKLSVHLIAQKDASKALDVDVGKETQADAPEKPDGVLAQVSEKLSDAMGALNVKTPAAETDGKTKMKQPVVIEDVDLWKAGLQVSAGAVPQVEIAEFEDMESKL